MYLTPLTPRCSASYSTLCSMLCCAASYLSDSESDETGSVSSEEEEHEMHRVVFVSSPEPAWLTRDWRRRLWHARYGTAAYMGWDIAGAVGNLVSCHHPCGTVNPRRAPTPGFGCHTGCPVITQACTCTTYRALPASRQSSIVPAHKGGAPLPRARGPGICRRLRTWRVSAGRVF
jgi:hypothetical protein